MIKRQRSVTRLSMLKDNYYIIFLLLLFFFSHCKCGVSALFAVNLFEPVWSSVISVTNGIIAFAAEQMTKNGSVAVAVNNDDDDDDDANSVHLRGFSLVETET